MHTQTLPIGTRLPLQRRAQTCSRKPQRIQAQANAAFAATLEKSQQSPQTAQNQLDALKQVCHGCGLTYMRGPSAVSHAAGDFPDACISMQHQQNILHETSRCITSTVRSSWVCICYIAMVDLVLQHVIPALQMSLVVADTGEIESIRKFRPVDCTTNPSLVLKAVQNPQYAHYLPKAIDAEDGPISNSERCAVPMHACGLHPSSSCCSQMVGLVGPKLKDCAHL